MTPVSPNPDPTAGRRVLVVDDNESNRYLLQSLLAAHGYEVDLAPDGRAALEVARRVRPDLVVADILMPVMDGFALCRAWQLDADLRPVPFLFYTATYTEPRDRKFGLDLGAVDYVVKPEEPDALLERIRSALAGHRATGSAARDGGPPPVREATFLREYNEALIHKLEDKMLELERANRELNAEVAERRLSESRLARQARLLDMATDAIACIDLDGVIRYWNRGAERVFGLPAGDAVGIPWAATFGPFPDPVRQLLNDSAAPAWSGELNLQARDGTPVTVDSRWTLVRDDAGTPERLLLVCTDVTAKKVLEEQFLRSQRMEVIGTMASGVAHDLNNILTPLVVAAPMLREAILTPRALGLLQAIESSAERATGVLRQMLEFGRGRKGDRLPVDPETILREVAGLVRETFPRWIRVACRVDAGLPPVLGDATQLHQLLLNLCLNARDAMPEGGTLELSAVAVESSGPGGAVRPAVRFGVADTGTGIAPDVLAKIFDPFFTTKDVGLGTGLGLATVQSIAHSHDGTVAVWSRVGEGTRFDIDLPAASGRPAAPPAAPSPAAAPGRDPATDAVPAVLVVDDDPAIRDIVCAILEQRGHVVVAAGTPHDAVALAADPRTRVAVVVADVIVPGVQGLELFQRLRAAAPAARLVAMSGLSQTIAPDEFRAAGVAHVLAKPFTGAQLLAAVEDAGLRPPPATGRGGA